MTTLSYPFVRRPPLLSPEKFAPLFSGLAGKRVGLCPPPGNVGDRMIVAGTLQLLEYFGIAHEMVEWPNGSLADLDVLLYGGGGNMGNLWRHQSGRTWLLHRAEMYNLAVICLPQSWFNAGPEKFDKAYVRELSSLVHYPEAQLAPDLALAYSYHGYLPPATVDTGVYLRQDKESLWPDGRNRFLVPIADPISLCETAEEYVELAARYRHVITDRLHFAVAGLIAGRRVTLLPNSYHKNRGMYEAWLRHLGCDWMQP